MDCQSSNCARNIALLYRQQENIVPLRTNSPNVLHAAVALGLPCYAREIVDSKPELALSFDEHGLTPCHLAIANGEISVIKELLKSKVGADICRLWDKGGFLPIHTAVMKGNVDVFKVVNDTCQVWMLRESTRQGDNILHLALKSDSLEVFHYLWHFFSEDKKLFNSRDAEGNTLLDLAVTRRHHEIVKMLVGKLDLNAINRDNSTTFDIFSKLGHEDGDMTLGKIIRTYGRMTTRHDSFQHPDTRQPDWLQSIESRTLRSTSKPRKDNERDMGNTLMVVAALIATITFQSALNPPGGFIQSEEDMGMAALERYLGWYLLCDIMAFISSLNVILLIIYGVPKWKYLIKLAMFITWVSVFFTFLSLHYGILFIFGRIIRHPLIAASLSIGYGIMLVFAFSMFIYTWHRLYKSMSTFLPIRSTIGMVGKSKIVAIACLGFLGAAIVWLPIVVLDIISSYYSVYLNYLSVAT